MPPTFYYAIGSRPARCDLEIALLVGQREFLIPIGSTLTETLRRMDGVSVVFDSAAWPLDNPSRPSLEEYADELLRWRDSSGSWGNLAWAAGYDYIGDPGRTQQDYYRLLGLLKDAGGEDCPIVPVTHYPNDALTTIILDIWHGPAGARADVVDNDGTITRPGYAIGGLVPPLSPTQPRAVFEAADEWYTELVRDLEWEVECEGVDEALLQLHLFGIGRASFVLRSPLVQSFDSSGPAQMAKFGWQKIQSCYNHGYGLSAEKLQRSRAARLAYWLIDYRSRMGLDWRKVDEAKLEDDREKPAIIQHSLFDLLITSAA